MLRHHRLQEMDISKEWGWVEMGRKACQLPLHESNL